MAKDDDDKSGKIEEAIAFNEDKTIITYTVTANGPISEDEFIYCLSDFIRCYGEGFQFSEVGELVPFDMFLNEDPPDGVYH